VTTTPLRAPVGIRVADLHCTPPGAARPAVDGVSFTLEPGEYIAVLGHNGSGKSTLARHLNGLLQPQRGAVTVDGLSTAAPAELAAIRRRVGLIFQNPDHQIVGANVEEDVLWGMPAGLDAAPGLGRGAARRRSHRLRGARHLAALGRAEAAAGVGGRAGACAAVSGLR